MRTERPERWSPIQAHEGTELPDMRIEIRDDILVAHFKKVEREFRAKCLKKLHCGAVGFCRPRERQQLVSERMHVEQAAEATEHHVARIADGQHDLRFRENSGYQRQPKQI